MKFNNKETRSYYVVHPLDDVPEVKVNVDELGRMPMTRSVKLSLLALQGYLVLIGLLLAYHVLNMVGVIG
jgi:hypothetical protein